MGARARFEPGNLGGWPEYLALAILGLLITVCRAKWGSRQAKGRRLPPGPSPWPVVGNLLQIGGAPHLTLQKFNQKYGPLVFLRIGAVPAVVTDDPRTVKELLLSKGSAFASRPPSIASEHFTFGGNDIAFAPYGPHWRFVRKICSAELLTPTKIDSFRDGRNEEVQCAVADVLRASARGEAVDMRELFGRLASNVITRMVLGQRFFGAGDCGPDLAARHRAMICESFALIGAFNVGDYLPFLRPLDLQRRERRMKEIMEWVNTVYDSVIEHQRVLAAGSEQAHGTAGRPVNFVHTLLSLAENEAEQGNAGEHRLNMTKIKAILIDLFAAGTDTTSFTSEWAMSELLRHPQYMNKVRQEIDAVVGHGRLVEESDLAHFKLLRAVVKESFRLHPVDGLLIPHQSMEDTEVCGYDIPKNTTVLINVYSLGRNPAVWHNAERFEPERFMAEGDDQVDFNDPYCRIIPFGAGRRSCPGANVGMKVILLGLSRLIHLFDWSPPSKPALDDSDLAEVFGYTAKAVPLRAVAKPRLPALLHLS